MFLPFIRYLIQRGKVYTYLNPVSYLTAFWFSLQWAETFFIIKEDSTFHLALPSPPLREEEQNCL